MNLSTKRVAKIITSMVMICGFFVSPLTHAWDGVQRGAISSLEIAGSDNYSFRVALAGVSNLCNGGPSWAYLNDSDGNYKVYVASLMQAKALGNQVTIYSTLKNGFCHIGYISIY